MYVQVGSGSPSGKLRNPRLSTKTPCRWRKKLIKTGLDKDAVRAGLAAGVGAVSAVGIAPGVMECTLLGEGQGWMSMKVTSGRCVSSHQDQAQSAPPPPAPFQWN